MSGWGEPDDEQTRFWIAESRYRPSPIISPPESRRRIFGRFLSPGNQARAAAADDDFGFDGGDGVTLGHLHGAVLPIGIDPAGRAGRREMGPPNHKSTHRSSIKSPAKKETA